MALSFGIKDLHKLMNANKGLSPYKPMDPIENDKVDMDTATPDFGEDVSGYDSMTEEEYYGVNDANTGSSFETSPEQMAGRNAAFEDMSHSGVSSEMLDNVTNPMSQSIFDRFPQDSEEYPDALVQEIDNNAVSEEIPQALRKQIGLGDAISDVNNLFSDAGMLSNQTEFMRRVAASESDYGNDKLGDYSYGQFQMDPIKYRDFVERSQDGAAGRRADYANQYLREQFDDEEFDIRNLFSTQMDANGKETYTPNDELRAHDPLVSAMVARLGLGNIKETIKPDLASQADYWKRHWNTESGAGTRAHFIEKANKHGFGSPINIKGMTGP